MRVVLLAFCFSFLSSYAQAADKINKPYWDYFACVHVGASLEIMDNNLSHEAAIERGFAQCGKELKKFMGHQKRSGFKTGEAYEHSRMKKILLSLYKGKFGS